VIQLQIAAEFAAEPYGEQKDPQGLAIHDYRLTTNNMD